MCLKMRVSMSWSVSTVGKIVDRSVYPSSFTKASMFSWRPLSSSSLKQQFSKKMHLSLKAAFKKSFGFWMNNCFCKNEYSMYLFYLKKFFMMFSWFFTNLCGMNIPPDTFPSISSCFIKSSTTWFIRLFSILYSFTNVANDCGFVQARKHPLIFALIISWKLNVVSFSPAIRLP